VATIEERRMTDDPNPRPPSHADASLARALLAQMAVKNCGCGGLFQAVDHYIPVSRGGAHTLANVRPACNRCNSHKGVKMPEGIQ
jgi:5-methylcytosine-specific restriction endonuclease McrA